MGRAGEGDAKRRVLLLAPATSYRIADFLGAARRLGVAVTVGSDRRQSLEALSDGGTMTVDLADPERGVAQIVAYHRDRPIDAIVAVDEEATIVAAAASAALGLAHNSPQAVAAAGDKHRMRTTLAAAGLACPGFSVAAIGDGAAAAMARARYPCVLKPLALSASRGVIRADDDAAFEAAFTRIAAILVPGRGAESGRILIEDFVPGAEVAVEALVEDGRLHTLALFDKPDPLDGPFFEETIYVTPSRLSEGVQRAISDTVAGAAAALGLRDGPIHAELRLPPGDPPGDPVVIDIAARSIGGLCARALRFGAGIGLEELILRHALGLPVESHERERPAAGVMMIPIARAGVLRRIGGRAAAGAVAGIEEVTMTIPVGQRLVPLPEGNRYLGFIVARGDTAIMVEDALREAHRRLDIDIGAEAEG